MKPKKTDKQKVNDKINRQRITAICKLIVKIKKLQMTGDKSLALISQTFFCHYTITMQNIPAIPHLLPLHQPQNRRSYSLAYIIACYTIAQILSPLTAVQQAITLSPWHIMILVRSYAAQLFYKCPYNLRWKIICIIIARLYHTLILRPSQRDS